MRWVFEHPKHRFKSLPEHMLWILKRTISMSTKTNVKADGKNIHNITLDFFVSRLDKKKFQHNIVNYRPMVL